MKIHAIQTGTVEIHKRQVVGEGSGLMRSLNMLRDSEWTPPLPILAWVIEHPEGVIVVDTGDTARHGQPGYHPPLQPFFRSAVRFHITPDQEIGPQLQRLGIKTSDVRTVILTHLHCDHSGGLYHFPTSEIWVHPAELAATRGVSGYISGYLPQHFPDWFKPKSIIFTPIPFGAFSSGLPITRAGDVIIVPTYGHTPSHLSVIVVSHGAHFFLAGDTSYTEKNLQLGLVDGVSPDVTRASSTLQTILAHAKQQPTVYLPSHDPESITRLSNMTVLSA